MSTLVVHGLAGPELVSDHFTHVEGRYSVKGNQVNIPEPCLERAKAAV